MTESFHPARDPGSGKEINIKKHLSEQKEKAEHTFVVSGSTLRSYLGGINLLALISGFVWIIQSYDNLNHTIASQSEKIQSLQKEVERLNTEVRQISNKVIVIETELRIKKESPK